jgi:hypothetical protein
MIMRCTNKKFQELQPKYKNATVCKRWLKFTNFLKDMGPRPGMDYSLDRIDNDNMHYCKANCRWTSKQTQQRNRSAFNKWIYYSGPLNGFKKTKYMICELADLAGISDVLLRTRLHQGIELDIALQPINLRSGKPLTRDY